jgi:hypothetical protein
MASHESIRHSQIRKHVWTNLRYQSLLRSSLSDIDRTGELKGDLQKRKLESEELTFVSRSEKIDQFGTCFERGDRENETEKGRNKKVVDNFYGHMDRREDINLHNKIMEKRLKHRKSSSREIMRLQPSFLMSMLHVEKRNVSMIRYDLDVRHRSGKFKTQPLHY